jgi:hypothetical protein
VNIRHHRHQYHIITATTVANTTDITIVKAVPPPDHRIISLQSRIVHWHVHAILASEQAPPPHNIRLTSTSLLRHGSIRLLLDIVLPQMSYLFPTSRFYFDILLVSPTPTIKRTPAVIHPL